MPTQPPKPMNPTIDGQGILSTLNQDGSRRWIKPRPSAGRFLASRRTVAWLLILLFTTAPYLKSGGKPLFLLDIASRRFTLFGRTFLPTDTVLLALFVVGVFVAIFLLTSLFGRVWCGWACPQTVYMEFVYRPIERLFEGAPGRRRRSALASSPAARPLKFLAYLAVSAFLAHTFLAWFVGIDQLLVWVRGSPLDHPAGFLVMAATTALMLFDFGYFREQMCIVACPYGRFQSVLLDRSSLVVSYDPRRGEPRGKRGPKPAAAPGADPAAFTAGDCVDCGLCVATCPTGIDIRNGLQMECINCAQCIDACDAVMTKLKRPRGLIRYSSQAAIAGESRRFIRPRVLIYPAVLLIIAAAFIFALGTKGTADITVLRGLGRPFTELPGHEISNPLRVKIVNRADAPATFLIDSPEPSIRIASETDPIVIEPGKSATVAAAIIAPAAAFKDGALATRVRISGPGFQREIPYRMMGPATQREHDTHDDDEHHDHDPDEDHAR